jgi:hypothetical protein
MLLGSRLVGEAQELSPFGSMILPLCAGTASARFEPRWAAR